MKETFGPLTGIVWFGLVLGLAIAMFIFAAIFVIIKSLKKGFGMNKIDLPNFSFLRFIKQA